jgi:hypothetical protein
MRLIAGLIVLGLGTSASVLAQGDSWDARDSSDLSLAVPQGADEAPLLMKMNAETRCPPGDAWDRPLPEMSWNTLEVGIAIDTPLRVASETEPRLYSRYTCQRPIDKP